MDQFFLLIYRNVTLLFFGFWKFFFSFSVFVASRTFPSFVALLWILMINGTAFFPCRMIFHIIKFLFHNNLSMYVYVYLYVYLSILLHVFIYRGWWNAFIITLENSPSYFYLLKKMQKYLCSIIPKNKVRFIFYKYTTLPAVLLLCIYRCAHHILII